MPAHPSPDHPQPKLKIDASEREQLWQLLREGGSKTMLDEMKAAGTHKKERVITSVQSAHITVSTAPAPVLNLCANKYLGLADHPALIAAAKQALDDHGGGGAGGGEGVERAAAPHQRRRELLCERGSGNNEIIY
jgi:7-keto-8-aminopelargonate synthetase-like enzyme